MANNYTKRNNNGTDRDYYERYGHMGPVKVMKAILECFYVKNLNKLTGQ